MRKDPDVMRRIVLSSDSAAVSIQFGKIVALSKTMVSHRRQKMELKTTVLTRVHFEHLSMDRMNINEQ